jgi:hypothetical protein
LCGSLFHAVYFSILTELCRAVNDRFIAFSVSIVGTCETCVGNDIEATPGLIRLMTNRTNDGTKTFTGKVDLQF